MSAEVGPKARMRIAIMGTGRMGGYLGAKLGVDTPVHRVVYAGLKAFVDGR